MDQEFWHARWSSNEIGFHLNEVNPYLIRYWSSLGLSAGSRILVPLCGKSLDLRWLLEQGHSVLGVELSRKAVEDFFAEQRMSFTVETRGEFVCFSANKLEIWCGDFFALNAADVADCRGLYDRAALIALPVPMRERYAKHLTSILPSAKALLITLEYPQAEMGGPPFCVPEAEVRERFASDWQVEFVLRSDALQQNSRFRDRGLSALHEMVFRLSK